MRKSLGELINTALSDADSALKLASARDAEIRSSGDFLDAELVATKLAAEDSFSEKEREGTKKLVEKHERKMHGEEEETSEKKSSRSDFLGAASYAMKLAEALEIGAHVVAKVAADTDPSTHEQKVTVSTGGAGASPLKAPGPQVMASGFIGAQTIQPKAQSAGAERITGPATTAGSMPTSIADHTGNLDGEQPPNNTGKTAGFTRSKEASARLLRAKQAQAETLMRMGQIKEAERLLAEVEKAAQDPSSPGPELPAHSNSYMLSTEPGDSTMIPDNAGLISMNKAQAKDRSVRTATEYVHEQPKLDNAVAAHALTTQGQKVSSLIVDTVKMAKQNSDNTPAAAIGGALLGGIGGAIGGAIEGARKGEAGMGALRGGGGAMAGGLIGNALGAGAGLGGQLLGGAAGGALGAHLATAKYRKEKRSALEALKIAKEKKDKKGRTPAAAIGGALGGGIGGAIGGAIEGGRHGEAGMGALRGGGGAMAGGLLGNALAGAAGAGLGGRFLGASGGGALGAHLATAKYRKEKRSELEALKIAKEKKDKKDKKSRAPAAAIGGALAPGLGGAVGGAIEGARKGEAGKGALRGGLGSFGGSIAGALPAVGQVVAGKTPGVITAQLLPRLGGAAGAHLATRKYRED